MLIQAFPSGPLETNAYLIACPASGCAAIVDPSYHSFASVSAVVNKRGFKLQYIWLTHSHWDHIADAALFKKKSQLPLYVHAEDAGNMRQPGSDGIPCWIDIEAVEPDHLIVDGEQLPLGSEAFTVIHTPGHSPGSVCFYNASQSLLLAGDTLFKGSIGSLSLPTAQPERMWPSLKKLAALPPLTRVFPGHGPATTIAAEQWLPQAQQLFGY